MGFIDKPEIGRDGGETHHGDSHHHWFWGGDTAQKTIGRHEREERLRQQVMPHAIPVMFSTMAHAQPALPSEIDRQCGEIEHHPAKDIGDRLRLSKDGMVSQMWVGACRVVKRCQTDQYRREPCDDHRLHEERAGSPMQRAAFTTGNRNPDYTEPHRSGSDVQTD